MFNSAGLDTVWLEGKSAAFGCKHWGNEAHNED